MNLNIYFHTLLVRSHFRTLIVRSLSRWLIHKSSCTLIWFAICTLKHLHRSYLHFLVMLSRDNCFICILENLITKTKSFNCKFDLHSGQSLHSLRFNVIKTLWKQMVVMERTKGKGSFVQTCWFRIKFKCPRKLFGSIFILRLS